MNIITKFQKILLFLNLLIFSELLNINSHGIAVTENKNSGNLK